MRLATSGSMPRLGSYSTFSLLAYISLSFLLFTPLLRSLHSVHFFAHTREDGSRQHPRGRLHWLLRILSVRAFLGWRRMLV